MKKAVAVILFALFPWVLMAGNELDSLLRALDHALENSGTFTDHKEQKLNELRTLLGKAVSEKERYDLSHQLYGEYRSYKYDSAYRYAERMLLYAEIIRDPNLISESKIALAFSCVSAGLYKEATDISNSIDTINIDQSHKADVYTFLSTLNLSMSDFATSEPYYSRYRSNSLQYCRNAMALMAKESPEAMLAGMREHQLMNNYANAIVLAERFVSGEQSNRHNYAIAISTLGFFYEVARDTTKAMECFARAAITDIEMAVKETSAIRQLAELLYLRGDIKHAYKYAMAALDDANFYNARQRKIEVGRTLPIIEAGRFELIEQQKNKLLIFSGLISLLFVLLGIATLIILRQKKRLNSARDLILKQNSELKHTNEQLTLIQQKISKQNEDLLMINEKLREVHQIKDEYIGYFFSANSAYLEKKEEYIKMVTRKVRNHQQEELLQEFAAVDLHREKEEMYTLFDRIFIKIFPEFVKRYNLLFKEEDQFTLKADGTLSPEIRIFALIRLGITESERIARFLDFSISTVKNYKSKAKNRSIVPNELFEQKIMEIESVKTEIQDKIE